MTDISKYRNVSLTHNTYKTLINLSKVLLPETKLSVSKTIGYITFFVLIFVETINLKEYLNAECDLSG